MKPAKRRGGLYVNSGANNRKGSCGGELGNNLETTDFFVAASALPSQNAPGDNRDVIVPFELLFAMQADGTFGVCLAFLSANLAAEEGAKGGAEDKHKDKK